MEEAPPPPVPSQPNNEPPSVPDGKDNVQKPGTPESSLKHDRDVKAAIEDAERAKKKQEEAKNKSRWRRIKETLVEWGTLSSCHGVPHMAQAHSVLAVIVWIVILIICFSIFLYLFIDTLAQYLAFDKLVELQMDLEEMAFPSVTICNINPYKESAIQLNPQLKALLQVYDQVVNGDDSLNQGLAPPPRTTTRVPPVPPTP